MPISADCVRYIKLGKGGRWADAALSRGELHFGYGKASHDVCSTGDQSRIKAALVDQGRRENAAARDAAEISEFYKLGSKCLWITFAREQLWWAFASTDVTWIGGPGLTEGERVRKTIGGWRNTDLKGNVLRVDMLSSKLTKVAGYRRTICKVEAEDYLIRRINGEDDPLISGSVRIQNELQELIVLAIKRLHQDDFETLVDIIFARSGWNRVSALGKTLRLIDMEVEQPVTSERAAIQVKSSASQPVLDDYIARIDEAGRFDRFFFVCHSVKGRLLPPADRADVHVWTGSELAEKVLRLGLQRWVFEKIA